MKYQTHSTAETIEIAKKLSSKFIPGTILCLRGELGSGKTTFVKGIAEGLKIDSQITSPTFTLMNVYRIENNESRIKELIHIDTYRLKNEQELIDIGAEDYLGGKNCLTVIEWPEKIASLLKNKNVVNIYFNHVSKDSREIEFDF